MQRCYVSCNFYLGTLLQLRLIKLQLGPVIFAFFILQLQLQLCTLKYLGSFTLHHAFLSRCEPADFISKSLCHAPARVIMSYYTARTGAKGPLRGEEALIWTQKMAQTFWKCGRVSELEFE